MVDEKQIMNKVKSDKVLSKEEKDYMEKNLKFFDKVISRYGMDHIGTLWLKGTAKESYTPDDKGLLATFIGETEK